MREDRPASGHGSEAGEEPSALQFALRESRRWLGRRTFWIVLGTGIVLVALGGPFYTLERMGLGARLIYWGLSAGLAGLLQTGLSMYALRIGQRRGLHWLVPATISGLIAILPVMLMVYGADLLTTGEGPSGGFWSLLPYVSGPVLVINIVVNGFIVASQREASAATGLTETPGPPVEIVDAPAPAALLFDKLPAELGQDLICLRAQDHYVEATTTLGSATILLRLSDAELSLGSDTGLRVHRSWWVNLDHVTGMTRTAGGGMELTTSNGLAIPVARGQRAVLRAALDRRLSDAAE
ncbi:MAG: LytTR family DNA-binding domain-containing protein [Pararhodobacter sp.]